MIRKMRTFVFLAFLTASLSATLACGNSPLFNHETASSARGALPTDRAPVPAVGACPLELPASGLCASLTWNTALSSDAENSATLRFWDKATGSASGPYRDADGEVAMMLWMPAMGHGSSPIKISPLGDGVYSASQIYFIMPGSWEVRVQIKKNHQLFEQAVLAVTL